jgi:hypothetical protein
MYRGGPRARRQLTGTVEEDTVPGRAVHRPHDTNKRSGPCKPTVRYCTVEKATVSGIAVHRPADTYKRSGAM